MNAPRDADDADAVVANAADRAAHVRAVAVVVPRNSCAENGVDAVHIVAISVAIVVNAVAALVKTEKISAAFAGIDPHVRGEVFVGVTRAGVDDGHDNVGGGVLDVPAVWSVDVRARHATVDAGVVQRP